MLHDRWIWLSFLLAFVALGIGFAAVYASLIEPSALLVIHFDAGQGIDFLGSLNDVYGILWSGLVLVVTNVMVAYGVQDRLPFLARMVAVGSLLMSLLILLSVSVILSVN